MFFTVFRYKLYMKTVKTPPNFMFWRDPKFTFKNRDFSKHENGISFFRLSCLSRFL